MSIQEADSVHYKMHVNITRIQVNGERDLILNKHSAYLQSNEGRLIGLLCINKDMRAARSLSASLQNFLESFNLLRMPESEFSEDLNNPVASIMYNQISEIIAQSGIAPSRMSPQEKARVVHKMDDAGILMMKGAVQEIANQLGVSVPTVYRYLNK